MGRFSVPKTSFSVPIMSPTAIPHLLFERGRYYYQRKVPIGLQDVIGSKKWREAVGADRLPWAGFLIRPRHSHPYFGFSCAAP